MVIGGGITSSVTPAGAATGPATKLVVVTPATLSQGTGIAIGVTAEDADGDVVKDYTGTVSFSSSDPDFVPITAGTLTNGEGIFYSTLATLGEQTITATDTVTKTITGTSAAIDVVRPSATTVTVTGSSLADVTASPESLTPAFSPSATDYVLACPAATSNVVALTLTAAAGKTIVVDGMSGSALTLSETLRANQAVVLEAPSPGDASKTRSYWIRCLPPDFPTLQSAVSKKPPAGWLLTGTGGSTDHYVMVLNSVGTPVWWRSTGQYTPANLQALQNETLGWGWGFVEHQDLYSLNTGTTAVLKTEAHDLYQLPNGGFLAFYELPQTGVDLSAIGDGTNQTIYDCQIKEYSPQLKLQWTWNATDHISPDESQNPVEAGGIWDVYHCNSIDADPNSPDPNNPNMLLSMRDTNGVYYIVSPEAATDAGQVLWKLGGGAPLAGSPDASAEHYVVSDGLGFAAQHDARFGINGGISLFDDGSPPLGSSTCEHAARGGEFYLHPKAATATTMWQYSAPSGLCATFEGSFRRYADGNDNVIGWGSATGDFMSEVDQKGRPILTITSPAQDDNYRVIKAPLSALDDNQLREDMGGLPPVVTGITPPSAPAAGGTAVTLSGRGFTQAVSVHFGSVAATSFTVNSDESITATTPASTGDGAVRVTVTNSAGTSAKGRVFTYTG
jgi:hypothetical protein